MKTTAKILVLSFLLILLVVATPAYAAKTYNQPIDPQSQAFEQLRARSGDLNLELSANGVPSMMFGYLGRVNAPDFKNAALETMRQPEIRDAFRLREGIDEFAVRLTHKDEFGQRHVRLMQYYRGIPVWQQELVVHLGKYKDILGINGDFVPNIEADIAPALSQDDALRVAMDYLKVSPEENWQLTNRRLVIYNRQLCWEVHIYRNPADIRFVHILAIDGQVVHEGTDVRTVAATGTGPSNAAGTPSAPGTRTVRIWDTGTVGSSTRYQLKDEIVAGKYIQTYYRNGAAGTTGTLLTSSTTTFSNATANGNHMDNGIDAHYYARTVYDYYLSHHSRNGIDNANMNITSSVWVTDITDNAMWSSGQMWYGNVSSETGNPCFNEDQDTVAHELTHGVTEHSANLNYENQSGALNESMSDVFAAMLDTADWMLFEDGDCPGHAGLRNMQDPTLHGQPAGMSGWVNSPNTDPGDWGGVHTNSGIPNHACYLLTAGGTYGGTTTTGVGYAKAEKIYYRALTSYMVPTSDFYDTRRLMIQSAKDLYGAAATEATSVANAWKAVGVDGVSSSDTPKAINDNATATSTIAISGLSGTISSVDVSTDIIHTYRGDLKVSVKSPDGTTVILSNNAGGSAINLVTTFDTLTAPYQSLSAFNGKSPNGTWTLTVQDTATGDTGTLYSWSLILATSGSCTVPAATTLVSPASAATGVATTAVLDWSDVTGATSYDVQVCSDSGCASVVRSASVASSTWTVSPALSNNTTYYWRARASNSCGAGSWTSTRSFTTASGGGCATTTQLQTNPGFESGATGWYNYSSTGSTAGIITNDAARTPHAGSYYVWLNGYGTANTQYTRTSASTMTIPAGACSASFTFWLKIDTAETTTTLANDTMKAQISVYNSGTATWGTYATLATYSNLNKSASYSQKTFDLAAYKGSTIRVRFYGVENASLQTSFLIDDVAVNVTQ